MRGILFIMTLVIFVGVIAGWLWLFDAMMLRPARHPNEVTIRCEEGLGGVMIDGNCFAREAVHWTAEEGPK